MVGDYGIANCLTGRAWAPMAGPLEHYRECYVPPILRIGAAAGHAAADQRWPSLGITLPSREHFFPRRIDLHRSAPDQDRQRLALGSGQSVLGLYAGRAFARYIGHRCLHLAARRFRLPIGLSVGLRSAWRIDDPLLSDVRRRQVR